MALEFDLPLLLVVAGVVLMVLEALAPGAHFVVLGVSLLAAGLVGLAISQSGFLVGSALIVALSGLVLLFGAVALYIYREFEFYEGTDAGSTSDSSSLRGQTGRVVERVTPTGGQVKLDRGGFNPYYQARSMKGEIAEGEEVLVIDPGGGNVLTVESFSDIDDEIDRELERDRRRGGSGGSSADRENDEGTGRSTDESAPDRGDESEEQRSDETGEENVGTERA